jgi:hypothetical protein
VIIVASKELLRSISFPVTEHILADNRLLRPFTQ